MKKTFKRVLSTVIALCVLLASATCLMGMTASADDTVVYAWTNSGQHKVAIPQGSGLATGTAVLGENPTTHRVTFDYYNPMIGSEFSVQNYSGTGCNGAQKITVGRGSVDVTITAKSAGAFALGIQSNKAHTGTLYIWNIHLWVNGVEKEVTGLKQDTAITTTTYGEIPFPDESDTDTAFKWSGAAQWNTSSPKAKATDSAGLAFGSSVANVSTVRYSFNYFVDGETSNYGVQTNGGASPTATINESTSGTRTLASNQVGVMDVTFVAQNTNAMGPTIQSNIAGNPDLYIWNVKVWMNGAFIAVPAMTNATAVDYDEIPLPEEDDDVVDPNTTVYAWTNPGQHRAAQPQGSGLVIPSANKDTSTTRISFDYYNPIEGSSFTAQNYSGDGSVGKQTFGYGTGSIDATLSPSKDGSSVLAAGIQSDKAHIGTLYIWNLKVWVDGVEKEVTGLKQGDAITTTTYGEIPFDNNDNDNDDNDDEDINDVVSDKVFIWTDSRASTVTYPLHAKPNVDGEYSSADYVTHQSVAGVTNARITFDYYNAIPNSEFVVQNYSGAGCSGAQIFRQGAGSMDVTITAVKDNAAFAIGIQSNKNHTGSLYIWNVRVWLDGDRKSPVINMEKCTMGEMSDIPDDEFNYMTEFDFADVEQEETETAYNTYLDSIDLDEGEYTLKFEYFLAGKYTHNVAFAGEEVNALGTMTPGLNSFEKKFEIADGEGFSFGIQSIIGGENAKLPSKLYIWDIKVVDADGNETAIDNTATWENELNGLTLRTLVLDEYYFVRDLPEIKEENKMMLKQENYKYREDVTNSSGDMGATLTYQGFCWVLKQSNDAAIKPETTYVFTFEYYSDPGPFEIGVSSAAVMVRTFYSGTQQQGNADSPFVTANQDMIWNADAQKYGTVGLNNIGRRTFKVEFTTVENQVDFFLGFQTGFDGDLYAWDFKLVEKGGDGRNLLTYPNFYGEWDEYESIMDNNHKKEIFVTSTSIDGKGSYSFVPFNQEIADLTYGDYILPESEFDDIFGDDDEEEEEDQDQDSDEDTDDDYSDEEDEDEEVAETGDTSNPATAVAVMVFALAALTITSRKVFRKE